jgi:mannan endo-1,4-beta-mannosidase
VQTRAADEGTLPDVLNVLDDLADAGVTVIRTWAFADGPNQWNALQPKPGVYDERVFKALDRVIMEAGKRKLRLLLVLTNYWPEYGGMECYVRWSRQLRGLPLREKENKTAASHFYEDIWSQELYARFVSAVIQRVNTYTGIAYKNDPTILGWSPANEPECPSLNGEGCGIIAMWAHRAAALIKQLDPNHLVFMDCEGFMGPSTPKECQNNPYDCKYTGCDFSRDCNSPFIDVACCHLYPDLWLPDCGVLEHVDFAKRWIDSHVRQSLELGKPLVVSEFGKRIGRANHGLDERYNYFKSVFESLLQHMRQPTNAVLVGSMFWLAAAHSYPDYDGFSVYLPSRTATNVSCTSIVDGTSELIKRHAADVRELTQDLAEKDHCIAQVTVASSAHRKISKRRGLLTMTKEPLADELQVVDHVQQQGACCRIS